MSSPGHRKLRSAIKKRKLTEREAASLVGVSGPAMHRYLKDERTPTGVVLFRIEKEFGIEASEFYPPPRAKKSKAA